MSQPGWASTKGELEDVAEEGADGGGVLGVDEGVDGGDHVTSGAWAAGATGAACSRWVKDAERIERAHAKIDDEFFESDPSERMTRAALEFVRDHSGEFFEEEYDSR